MKYFETELSVIHPIEMSLDVLYIMGVTLF